MKNHGVELPEAVKQRLKKEGFHTENVMANMANYICINIIILEQLIHLIHNRLLLVYL